MPTKKKSAKKTATKKITAKPIKRRVMAKHSKKQSTPASPVKVAKSQHSKPSENPRYAIGKRILVTVNRTQANPTGEYRYAEIIGYHIPAKEQLYVNERHLDNDATVYVCPGSYYTPRWLIKYVK